MSQPFNHARLKFICHFLGKCLFHTPYHSHDFQNAIFSVLFDRRNNHIHQCSSLQDWQFVKHTVLFSVDLFPHTMFYFQNKFTLLCFSIFNFFLDCMIHKQSFGGKIIGFLSLKWPHNGYTVWGSKGKRSNSTPFCFGCPDTFVTGVYKSSETMAYPTKKGTDRKYYEKCYETLIQNVNECYIQSYRVLTVICQGYKLIENSSYLDHLVFGFFACTGTRALQ